MAGNEVKKQWKKLLQYSEKKQEIIGKKIYFASCAPIVKNTNQYGIYIPTKPELLAFENSVNYMKKKIGADYLIFNDLQPIINELRKMNPLINNFEVSMFQ